MFGVEDLIRSVWQWTDEFRGPHTANAVLRGGSAWSVHGGSRWYFRSTYSLNTFNTYHLMSGSYERASTIGFRCVADAHDDCGTRGRICVEQAPASSTASMDGRISQELTVVAISGRDESGRVFLGATNGFELLAPSSAPGNATLWLSVRSILGARGHLSLSLQLPLGPATAATVGHTKTLQLRASTTLLVKYRGGPLRVRYQNQASSICTSHQLCLLSVRPTCPARVPMMRCVTDLSTGVTDWFHWGTTSITAVWKSDPASKSMDAIAQHKDGRSGSLTARLLMPGCKLTDSSCHANASDLATWGSKFWPSDSARYSWYDGTQPNTVSSAGARAGAFSYMGTFELHIPANSTAAVRKLRVFTALFNYGKHEFGPQVRENWVNSATFVATSPGQPAINHTVKHMDGNNNDAVNTVFEVVFSGELTVMFGLDPASRACSRCGWVSVQAATLQEHHGNVIGGVQLLAAELKTDN
eukprot:COSAG01_NODE_319_length_18909_cov_32.636151_17_plen_472_part_00